MNDDQRLELIREVLQKASTEVSKITGEEIMVLCGFKTKYEDLEILSQSVYLPSSVDFDTAAKIYLSIGQELGEMIANRPCDECEDF